MDKTKLNIRYLQLLVLLLISMDSYSQEQFTKELKWKRSDSIDNQVFNDKVQIIEWSKSQLPFSTVYSRELLIKECNIYVAIVSGCSGLPCWNIYIFKEENSLWQLVTSANARLKEQIDVDVNNNTEQIVFITKSGQIGKLPFERLNCNKTK